MIWERGETSRPPALLVDDRVCELIPSGEENMERRGRHAGSSAVTSLRQVRKGQARCDKQNSGSELQPGSTRGSRTSQAERRTHNRSELQP